MCGHRVEPLFLLDSSTPLTEQKNKYRQGLEVGTRKKHTLKGRYQYIIDTFSE